MCQGVAIIDTHIAEHNTVSIQDGPDSYCGLLYREFLEDTPAEEREKLLWTSIDNAESFWPTRPSLYNLLGRAGFTSVYECFMPFEIGKPAGRVTFIAMKGEQQHLHTTPKFNAYPLLYWPEQESTNPERTTLQSSSSTSPSPRASDVIDELRRVQSAYNTLEARVIEQDRYLRQLEAGLQRAKSRQGLLRRLIRR